MNPLFSVPFLKLEGCGNSFILLNKHTCPEEVKWSEIAPRLSASAWGLGTDGVMLIGDATQEVIPIEMYNPDGSPMGMCGNGIRCVVRSLILSGEAAASRMTFLFEIEGKQYTCETRNQGRLVTVQMGEPSFDPKMVPLSSPTPLENAEIILEETGERVVLSAVSMGNPHCVLLEGPWEPKRIGPILEHHSLFPARTNVEFVEVKNRRTLRVAVWERGAGITLACGTGACASVVAFHRAGRCEREVEVQLPGGTVQVVWDERSNNVTLTGPVGEIAEGKLSASLFL